MRFLRSSRRWLGATSSRRLAACLGVCLLTRSGISRAEPQVAARELLLDFVWSAPESCPTRAEVVKELSRAVDSAGKELPLLTARAVVRQDAATWHLELSTEMDGRRGTRLLEADSCEGLSRAATLVLALTLGEGLARRQQAQIESRAAPARPPPQAPPAATKPHLSTPKAPLAKARMLLWAAAALGSDPLGTVGPGLSVGVAFQPNLLQVGARLGASLPRSTELSGSGGDVQSFSFSADLEGCLAPTLRALQFLACATGGVTALQVSGQGTALDRHESVPLYGLGASVAARLLLHENAFLNLGLVSRFFLSRPELLVEGLVQRRRLEAASVNAELGAGVRW